MAKIESTRAECSRLRLRDGFTLTQKIVTKAAALRKARRKVTDLEDELDDVTRELNGLELADELDAASLDIGNLAAKTHEAVSGDRNAIDKLMEELVKHKISRVNDYDRRAAEAKKACRMLDEIGTVSGQLDAMKQQPSRNHLAHSAVWSILLATVFLNDYSRIPSVLLP